MFTYKAQLHNCIFKEVIILLKFGAIWITFDFLGLLGLYTCFAAIPHIFLKNLCNSCPKTLILGPVAKKQGHTHNSNLIFAEDHLIDVHSVLY